MTVKHVVTLGIGASPTSLLWFITSGLASSGMLALGIARTYTPEAETRTYTPQAETRTYTPEAE